MLARFQVAEAKALVPFALGLLLIYAALLAWLPQGAFWGGDQGMKFLQIEALAGSPPRVALNYAGSTLAPETRFSPFNTAHGVEVNGRWYSVFPVAFGALSSVPYRMFGFFGLYVIPVASVLAAALLAFALGRQLGGVRDAALAMFMTALGSPLFIYGAILWEHALATALTTGAVLCLVTRGRSGRSGAVFLAGALVGVASWMRSEVYVFAAASALTLLIAPGWGGKRISRSASFVSGVVALLVPLWILNALLYGDPAGAHLTHNFAGGVVTLAERITRHFALRPLVALDAMPSDTPLWRAAIAVAVAGALALWAARARAGGRLPFLGDVVVALGCLLAASATAVILYHGGLVMSLVATCPWIVMLAGLALPGSDSDSSVERFLLMLALGYVLLVLLVTPIPGGVGWGGRLLQPAVPLLVVLAVAGRRRLVDRAGGCPWPALRRGVVLATATVLVAGVALQVGAIRSLHRFKLSNAGYVAAIVASEERVFVSSARWTVLAAAPVLKDRIFLRASTSEDFCTLAQRFAAADIKKFTYLAVPFLVPDASSGACTAQAGYRVSGRTRLRHGVAVTGIHFEAHPG